MVLKGVIDCPDLATECIHVALFRMMDLLGKIAEYISKKVADKLSRYVQDKT